jgi:subtilisin family serine protease
LVAGLVACLKGAHTNKSNAQIFEAILQSADRYDNPDNEYGHGIPNVIKADSILKAMPVLRVNKTKELEVSIYPNPVLDYIKIQTDPGAEYSLTNLQGQEIKAGTLINWINFVDVQDVQSGTYFIRVAKDDRMRSYKIVVE